MAFKLTSEPTGARIEIGGKFKGYTGQAYEVAEGNYVSPGTYKIKISKSGYQDYTILNYKITNSSSLHVTLKREITITDPEEEEEEEEEEELDPSEQEAISQDLVELTPEEEVQQTEKARKGILESIGADVRKTEERTLLGVIAEAIFGKKTDLTKEQQGKVDEIRGGIIIGGILVGTGAGAVVGTTVAVGGTTMVVSSTGALVAAPTGAITGGGILASGLGISGLSISAATAKLAVKGAMGVAGFDGIMVWMASDNVLTGTAFTLRKLREAVKAGVVSRSRADEELEVVQKWIDAATQLVEVSARLNPFIMPFRRILLINAEKSQKDFDWEKELIEVEFKKQ